jgi:hypothetical protein
LAEEKTSPIAPGEAVSSTTRFTTERSHKGSLEELIGIIEAAYQKRFAGMERKGKMVKVGQHGRESD